MAQQSTNLSQISSKNVKAIRRIVSIFNAKYQQKVQNVWHRLKVISITKSSKFIELKVTQFMKRLSKIFSLKFREQFNQLMIGSKVIEIQNSIKLIQTTKVKDRIYEAKVKSLRVLSRQWKQRKNQNEYKNKYFTPKSQQTPKMLKQKVIQDIYLTLRNILRSKYLQVFNQIKTTESIKLRNSKSLYLINYLIHKRKYWLTFSFQKLRLNVLSNRQDKNEEEISHLDTKLIPIQDSQIQSIKQKQQKLQQALDTMNKEKITIAQQVDTEVNDIEKNLRQKKEETKNLKERKQKLTLQLQLCKQKTSTFQFNKDQIFYLTYKNFLINLKLWTTILENQQNYENEYLSKNLILEWLQTPTLDFNLQKIELKHQVALMEQAQHLRQVILEYKRLRSLSSQSQSQHPDFQEIYSQYFSSNLFQNQYSTCSFQQFLSKNKYSYKMLSQVIKQNTNIMNTMLYNMQRNYQKAQGEAMVLE